MTNYLYLHIPLSYRDISVADVHIHNATTYRILGAEDVEAGSTSTDAPAEEGDPSKDEGLSHFMNVPVCYFLYLTDTNSYLRGV